MTAALALERISKSFGAVEALKEATFTVAPSTVVSLVGDNGAGKSTLMKIVSGMYSPTSGDMYLAGKKTRIESPLHARSVGIETVHQGLALVEQFNVAENFFLGRERSRFAFLRVVRDRAMREEADAAVANLGVTIPGGVRRKVESMSGGQRQAVAIARAAYWHTRLLLLDEPTAALGVRESQHVLALVDRVAHQQGAAVLMVTHNMEHVRRLSDKVIVLRQGRVVAILNAPIDTEEVVSYITGAREPQANPAEHELREVTQT